MPKGRAELRFSVSDATVRNSMNLKSPLLGTVYGNLFLEEDVSLTGPRDQAERFGEIEVPNVDLRTASESSMSVMTPELSPGRYVFLGFYDVNGNGSGSKSPDRGDPVTLPKTNAFEIRDQQNSKRLVVFELVYNQ
jgi:uncharacterized protein (DUF2141 family)